jgi:hypothetical protein
VRALARVLRGWAALKKTEKRNYFKPFPAADNGKKEDLVTTDLKAMLAPFYVKPVAEAVSKK